MGLLDLWRQAGADIDFARAAASEDVGDLVRMIAQPPDPTT